MRFLSEPIVGQLAPWGILVLAGLIDVDGLFWKGGTFDRGGAEDGIDFLILDVQALLLRDLGGFFTFVSEGCMGLRTNKLLEIVLIH